MTETQTRVALYARISEDPSGEAAGVQRQLDAGRELAATRGWAVVAERQDNNISALNGARRDGYRAILELVRSGAVDHVVCWQTSRLLRNRSERAAAIELFAKHRVGIIAVQGQDLDLSTAYGRGIAGMLGEFDTMESEVKSERVAGAAAQRAERGDPNGAIPFGWQRVIETNEKGVRVGARDIHDPEAAPIVKEVCERLLAGQTLRGVTDWLNEQGVSAPGAGFKLENRGRGITNPDGSRWGKTSVRKLALRPANAGMRMFHAGRPDERLLPAKIEPIISEGEWDRLCKLLQAPERKTAKPGARRHLLSWGIGQCGVCGGVLRVSLKGNAKHGAKAALYVCDAKGCVGRNQARVDGLVKALVVARLSRDDALDWLAGDDEAATEARELAAGLRARLEQATDSFSAGRITAEQLDRISGKLNPAIEEAMRAADAAQPDMPLELMRQMAGPAALERWDELEVAQRRALVAALIDKVVVLRVARRGPGFDPESVRVEWRSAS